MTARVQKALLLVSALYGGLFSACGVDEFYIMKSPDAVRLPTVETESINRYFDFNTNEPFTDSSSFSDAGTAVYYRIYTEVSYLNSAVSAINNANSSSTYSSAAQTLMGRGYQPLGTVGGITDPLIPATGTNQRVQIRLTNNQETSFQDPWSSFIADIRVNNSHKGFPRRNDVGRTFDFGRSGDQNKPPVTSENPNDTSGAKTNETDAKNAIYYVDMWAFAVGYDVTFANYYSRVLHLGSVKIDAKEQNN